MSATSKTAKSRSGCRTCKQRRVKCDETKPSCRQCALKSLECPGYATRWKWSTKHEQIQRAPVSKRARVNKPSDSAEDTPEVGSSPRSHRQESAGNHLKHVESVSENGDTAALDDEAEQALLNGDWDDVLLPTFQSSSTPRSLSMSETTRTTTPARHSFDVAPWVWQSPDTILSNVQIQVDFFSEKVCKALTAVDSMNNNPFRQVALSRTKDSLLFFSLCRYLTAAFLNSSASDATSALVVQNAQMETLQRLHNAVAQLDYDVLTRMKAEDILMAIIMFGLSTNWDGSNSPSILHYNAAVRLYTHACCGHEELFLHSLVYWWMGLAFVTDTTKECLLEPPPLERGNHGEAAKRIPHPLAGVSPAAQRLLGRAGSLIYAQRLRCREKSFPSMNQLQKEYEAVQRARSLEEETLSLQLPRANKFVDVGDTATPIQDLINTAEVYRLAALILLYRAFPDLLNGRLRLDEDGNEADARERRLRWVTALAIHALDILRQNSPHSGTRSIESILLVIIAGELQKRTCSSQISCVTNETKSESPSLGPSMAASTPLPTSPFDRFTALHDCVRSVFHIGHLCETSGLDRIYEARRALLKRLQSIRDILPYRLLERVQELVLKTWDAGDNDNPEVFWIDVMIDNELKFLLV
ncbi:hypothetical protein A1O7_03571 [Cladophialophora yegresii CBS 114405]|uniref:Zn(2)-C6 fungal-type domain-containing protein n=1 Tax=Cladophialophora yegresii CBS 114405 TaxID=1182544 RepID=W9WEX2_9EURO|nr:uncharacterized protein A1O7_03571 [Cladophialophora yegresii CBS 114405]EXJ63126.1 hypothetical protein A1O7_03571 [Cladophialophora yegresii CBS 114405]